MKPARSFKQTLSDNRKAERQWALLGNKPFRPGTEEVPAVLKPKRIAVVHKGESESDILHAIMALLKHHPKVGKVWRQNSATMQAEYGGKTRYVRANTARGMSDIAGILKTGRAFFIEVKRPGAKLMDHQADFLIECAKNGALAFAAWSVDDVLLQLEDL